MAWAFVRSLWIPTSREKLAESEAVLLQRVPGEVRLQDVPTDPSHTIHTVHVRSGPGGHGSHSDAPAKPPLVLVHGYGLGAAAWSANFRALAQTGHDVFAIDWPGIGGSSRPPFPLGRGREACEDFFVNQIEAWRQSLGLKRMQLVGHSMGGYFAACYAMRHPDRVEHLILASPAGFNGPAQDSPLTNPAARAALAWKQRLSLDLAGWLWESRYTPYSLVRMLGPLGSRLTELYVEARWVEPRRAGTFPFGERELQGYLYHLAAQPPCSDRCINETLFVGASARHPLAGRLVQSFRPLGGAAPRVSFLYGEHDWMDASAGLRVARELPHHGASPPEVFVVEGAGHHVFMDHTEAFNQAVRRALSGSGPDAVPNAFCMVHPSRL